MLLYSVRCWKLTSCFYVLLWALIPASSQASLNIKAIEVKELSWSPEFANTLEVVIPVTFTVLCGGPECDGEKYTVGVFDTFSSTRPFPGPQPVLQKYVHGNVKWICSRQRTAFEPGEWSRNLNIPASGTVSCQLVFKLNKKTVAALPPGNHPLTFWIAIVSMNKDTSASCHYVMERVQVNIVVPSLVRISQLKDINLHYSKISGLVDEIQSPFCVYATNGGWYSISFNGFNRPGDKFSLMNDSGVQLPYLVSFLDQVTQTWHPLNRAGRVPGKFKGSRTQHCGEGQTGAVKIEIPASGIHSVPVDIYWDYLTITVHAH